MRKMKLVLRYLKEKHREIFLFILILAIFFVIFLLYRLPTEALVYPAALSALLGLGFLTDGFIRFRRRHLTLQQLFRSTELMIEELPEPETAAEEDYQRIAAILQDAAAALSTRMELRHSDTIEYFTAWVHQIKTPIAAMRLYLQGEDTPLSRRVLWELLRIEQYVEMVLTYLRLDGASDYVLQEYELDDILRGAVKKYAGEFIARRLKLEYQPVNFRVLTDEKWLSIVIEQVLSNALKYTAEGTITISMETPGLLTIRDTGIGIAPEDLPRIFEKGYTGYNGRSDKKATGIGLYLCQRICRDLGHGISAQSEVDRGTVITVDLRREHVVTE